MTYRAKAFVDSSFLKRDFLQVIYNLTSVSNLQKIHQTSLMHLAHLSISFVTLQCL